MEGFSEERWLDRVDRLSEQGFVVMDDFLSGEVYSMTYSFLKEKLSQDEFSKAGIGALDDYRIKESIRGDFIFWLDRKRDVLLGPLFAQIEEVRNVLNRYCFLSLSDYEFHLALYPAGSFYRRHLDQFKGRNNRLISMIVYFNEGWVPEDGGALRIFVPDVSKESDGTDSSTFDVEPIANRCVLFRSDTLEHEVLRTNKGRMSLTGWFLYQPQGLGYLLG